VWFCREFDLNLDSLSTSCTVLIAIVGIMILYRIAKPMTKPHILLVLLMVAGLLGCAFFIGDFFAITAISKQTAMLMTVFALTTEPCLRYLSILVEWLHEKLVKRD
jgi:cation-transporting ATPase E